MEIIIKTKQQSNPLFSFLNVHDPLFPYYAHLKMVLASGSYIPATSCTSEAQETKSNPNPSQETPSTIEGPNTPETHETKCTVEEAESTVEEATDAKRSVSREPEEEVVSNNSHSMTETDSKSVSDTDSDSEEEDGYLHPLLMQTMTSRSKSSTPTPPAVPITTKEATPPPSFDVPTLSAVNFRARSMVVNAAPVLSQRTIEPPPPPPTTSNGNAHNR